MAKEKVKIDFPDSPFPFVPPVSELMGWLGGPKCLHTPLYWMQEELGLANKPDLKTLRKACQDGVTPRIAEMIEANIHQAAKEKGFTQILNEIIPTEPVVNGTNGTKWRVQARSLLEGINHYQPQRLELPRTFAFLKQRSEAESQLMLAIHRARKLDVSTEEQLALLHTAFCETCQRQTLLTTREIQVYGAAIIDANRPDHPRTLELAADALKCAFSLRVDFYHQLLASFMADMLPLREILRLPASLDDALVNHGGMGQLTPLVDQGELITATHRLYAFWRTAFLNPGEQPVSYRAMARHLPQPELMRTRARQDSAIESPSDILQKIADTADETRLSLLKQWRNGTVPEADHLTKFLESLSGEAYGTFLPFIMARVATVWTKWMEYEKSHLDALIRAAPSLANHQTFEWMVEKFSKYPEYWHHTMAQAKSGQPGP
ncbi:hypothetical protein SAMN02745148_01043 [Modicisalibacter ilicicola DSM 19980]|uniref:Uncharacterized protein n=1 Tax=Modicisalibacter ilicicola DSM 19980 TaxID=1121942 RepID=A0A1M4W2G0_9GAMM|nr:hypothetical protein [Halomonas ilicicola]SHE75152.1 hypothetical protein SAMN02745148_01043 [Halomonas ilicicola DSM 19980]